MRKPNGYGSIKHLSGHRRRPFVFVVTEQGRQKPVEYFTTQTEAEIFAADYNKIHRHTSLAGHRETLTEVYCRWRAAHIADTEPSASTITSYTNSWRHLEPLGPEPIAGLKHRDYQGILDRMRKNGLSYSSLKKSDRWCRSSKSMPWRLRSSPGLMRLSSGSVKTTRSARTKSSAAKRSIGCGLMRTSLAWIPSSSSSTQACAAERCWPSVKQMSVSGSRPSGLPGQRHRPGSGPSLSITGSSRS